MYYMATDMDAPQAPNAPDANDFPGTSTGDNHLDAYDQVLVNDPMTGDPIKGVEIFELSGTTSVANNTVTTTYARVEETRVNNDTGLTTNYYRVVDIVSEVSMTDGGDPNEAPDSLRPVTVDIPVAAAYEHLHFGVWASLGDADANGAQNLADLGIGFVQNISGSGITQKTGIGRATFEGDWVAAIQRAHAEGEGSIVLGTDKATLTANFGTGKFTGDLDGLADLSGDLDGNGFSGTTATVDRDNIYGLTIGASLDGMFEGGIYGADGAEAGGVFNFSSDSDGAFVGSFGGHRDGTP